MRPPISQHQAFRRDLDLRVERFRAPPAGVHFSVKKKTSPASSDAGNSSEALLLTACRRRWLCSSRTTQCPALHTQQARGQHKATPTIRPPRRRPKPWIAPPRAEVYACRKHASECQRVRAPCPVRGSGRKPRFELRPRHRVPVARGDRSFIPNSHHDSRSLNQVRFH